VFFLSISLLSAFFTTNGFFLGCSLGGVAMSPGICGVVKHPAGTVHGLMVRKEYQQKQSTSDVTVQTAKNLPM
jgi:hypothetical protein